MPEDQLPVTLPMLRGSDLKPKGTSPLGGATEWVNVACPTCGGPATRDTDTMDTFVDSSWYMFRYCSPHEDTQPFDSAKVNAWMPCNLYVGGVEHAVLHLLYGRFFTKVLNDMGLVDFREPWSAQLNQGFVINQGKKMSKSLGNGVDLGDQLGAFGVDAVRLTLVFAGPARGRHRLGQHVAGGLAALPAAGLAAVGRRHLGARRRRLDRRPGAAAYDGADGARRGRAGRGLPLQRDGRPGDGAGQRDPQGHRLRLRPGRPRGARGDRGGRDPAVAWSRPTRPRRCGSGWATSPTARHVVAGWPEVDEALLVEDTVTAVVQVRGKVRARLEVAPDISEADLEAAAMADEGVQRAIDGATVRKVIVRAPKLVNIVV